MQTVFLVFAIITGLAEGIFLLLGYLRALKGERSPMWFGPVKLALFCAFFAFWFLWNLWRNFP